MSEDDMETYGGKECRYCGTLSNVHLVGCPNEFDTTEDGGE